VIVNCVYCRCPFVLTISWISSSVMYARIAFPAAVQWGGNIAPTGVHTLMMVCGESKRSRQMTPPGVAQLSSPIPATFGTSPIAGDALHFVATATPPLCSPIGAVSKPRRYRSLSAFLSNSVRISPWRSTDGARWPRQSNSDASWVTPASGSCSPMYIRMRRAFAGIYWNHCPSQALVRHGDVVVLL